MSTRGTYGFKINGREFLFYSGSDSYPESLGKYVLNYIKNTGLKRSKKILEETKRILLRNMDFSSEEIENLDGKELYELLNRKVSVENAKDFIDDSLFCEYSYIINLDSGKLEVYTSGRNLIDELDINDIQKESDLANYISRIKRAKSGFEKKTSLFRLSLVDPSKNTNKFYEVFIDPDKRDFDLYHLYSIWGRVGSEGRTDLIHSGTLTEVMDVADQMRREKEKKGYIILYRLAL